MDTGVDWRELARRYTASLPAADASSGAPLAIAATDPLAYAAGAMATLAAGRDLLLGNPRWTPAEQAAAEALRLTPGERPTAGAVPSAPRILVATGGSGGVLRFATHTFETLGAAAHALQSFGSGGPLNSICLLPLHHISGFQQLVRALATDGELLLADWREVAAGRLPPRPPVTGDWMLSLVPTQLQLLLEVPAAPAWLRGFGTILLGGAPAGPGLLARARAAGLPLAPAYGASEFGAALAVQPPSEFLAGETGLRVLPHASVRIVDPATAAPSPPGELGRIEVSAASLFLGYWPHARPAGPFLTEDLGRLDAEGRLHVVGRADDAINTGGEKVQPAEVEAALRALGVFSEVLVCGAPDPRWGEAVTALYPASDAPDLAAVESALRAALSPHKLPRRWLGVAAWPRTAQGKTDRTALRRLARS